MRMKGAWPPHLLAAENPIPPALGPLPCQAPVGMDAHPRLLALGSVGQCRRLRNSSSSLGTSWFKYRMPWRREQRKPVIRLSRVICRAWCKMKIWGPSNKEVQDSQSRALNQARALLKDRNGMHLTEAEDIKKRWQEYTEELTIQKRSSRPR